MRTVLRGLPSFATCFTALTAAKIVAALDDDDRRAARLPSEAIHLSAALAQPRATPTLLPPPSQDSLVERSAFVPDRNATAPSTTGETQSTIDAPQKLTPTNVDGTASMVPLERGSSGTAIEPAWATSAWMSDEESPARRDVRQIRKVVMALAHHTLFTSNLHH